MKLMITTRYHTAAAIYLAYPPYFVSYVEVRLLMGASDLDDSLELRFRADARKIFRRYLILSSRVHDVEVVQTTSTLLEFPCWQLKLSGAPLSTPRNLAQLLVLLHHQHHQYL